MLLAIRPGAQRRDLGLRSEASAQQSKAVKLLDPWVFCPGGGLTLTKNQTESAQVARSKAGRGAVMFIREATNTAYRRRI